MMLKKTVAVLLCIMFVVQLLLVAAYEDEVIYSQASERVYALGIAAKSSRENVTRSEFTAMTIKLLNINPSYGDKEVFAKDIPVNHKNYSYLRAAYDANIILGDENGLFHPNAYISYAEAVKILLCALGYSDYAAVKGGYPVGFLTIAGEKNLSKTAANVQELSYDNAIGLIDSALELEIPDSVIYGDGVKYSIDESKTVLQKYFDIYTDEGVFSADYKLAFDGSDGVGKGCMRIGDNIYHTSENFESNYQGYYVRVYYKTVNDNRIVQYIEPKNKKNRVVYINDDEIDCYDNGSIYVLGKKREEFKISPSAAIVKNNRAEKILSNDLFEIENGDITLIDNNADEIYDVVRINEYENILVDTTGAQNGTINGVDGSSLTVDFNDSNVEAVIVDKSNNPIEFNKIVADSLISVLKSTDGSYIKLIKNDAAFAGTVEEYEMLDDVCTLLIDGKSYASVKGFYDKYSTLLKSDMKLNIYVDYKGKVEAVKRISNSDILYGFLIDYEADSNIAKSSIKFKLLTMTNEITVLSLASTVIMDSKSYKSTRLAENPDTLDYILKKSNGSVNSVIAYRLNADGDINYIDTAYVSSENGETDHSLHIGVARGTYYYATTSRNFEGRAILPTDAYVINVYEDRTGYDDQDFTVSNYTAFVNGHAYTIETYLTKENSMLPQFFVRYIKSGENSISNSSLVMIVDKISKVLDDRNGEQLKIYGYYNGYYDSICVHPIVSIEGIGYGDGIRFNSDPRTGEIIMLEKVFDYKNKKINFDTNPYARPYSSFREPFRIVQGLLYDRSASVLLLSRGDMVTGQMSDMEYHNIDTDCWVYYIKDNGIDLISIGDLYTYKNIGDNCSKIVIHTYEGRPKSIMVYN